MKEPSRGPLGRATAVAEGVAAAVRRRQRDREPRVVLHRGAGHPTLLAPGAKGHDAILDLAEQMTALAETAEAPLRPRREPPPGSRRAGR